MLFFPGLEEDEENVGIDKRGPELIYTKIVAAIDELKAKWQNDVMEHQKTY